MLTNRYTDNIFGDKLLLDICLLEKLNSCIGLATGLKTILYSLLEKNNITDKDFNCILALAESLESSLEKISKEINVDD